MWISSYWLLQLSQQWLWIMLPITVDTHYCGSIQVNSHMQDSLLQQPVFVGFWRYPHHKPNRFQLGFWLAHCIGVRLEPVSKNTGHTIDRMPVHQGIHTHTHLEVPITKPASVWELKRGLKVETGVPAQIHKKNYIFHTSEGRNRTRHKSLSCYNVLLRITLLFSLKHDNAEETVPHDWT